MLRSANGKDAAAVGAADEPRAAGMAGAAATTGAASAAGAPSASAPASGRREGGPSPAGHGDAPSPGPSLARRVAAALGALCVAVLLLASGFIACVLPPTTSALAQQASRADVHTAFSHDDMVAIACATRDYSFGNHDYVVLLQAIYQANANASAHAAASGRVLVGAPDLSAVDASDVAQLEKAFSGANERFVYSADAVSHLDDCFAVAKAAYVALAVLVVLAFACFAFARSANLLGRALFAAGGGILSLFALLGIWATADFDGLFAAFHGVLFAQGNWTFPADSLLICALPTEFWVGMGAVWFATSAIISILSILVGRRLAKKPAACR